MNRAYIVSAARTAIGGYNGSLTDVSPVELGKICAIEALKRAGETAPSEACVNEVILGNVLGAGHGMNLARQVGIASGLSVNVQAFCVNMVCGSGLKAVALAENAISTGQADCILAGGTESMSQAGYISHSLRFGARMGPTEFKDLMIQDGLTDAFNSCHMGLTAEAIAEKYGISRLAQDTYALESQSRAQAALKAGYFKSEIVSVPLMKRGKQIGQFEVDEHPRAETTSQSLAGLKPAFKKDGSVTAGNASGINDGAAMLLIVSEKYLASKNLKPLAEIVGAASAGIDPMYMGLGPVEAVKALNKRAGLTISQYDLIEANEAFAVQALAVSQQLELDPAKVNVWGGAIALGHPIGASGARILVTLVHQLRALKKKLGLATLCVGGGQGIALAVRSCE